MKLEEKINNLILKCMDRSIKNDDVPVGAVVVLNDKIISYGWNDRNKKNNILGHAEINAILKAQKRLKTWHLDDCELYVNLVPCSMCKSIIYNSHIKRVYYYVVKDVTKKEFDRTEFIKIDNYVSEITIDKLKKFFVDKR
jgi:tRNA(adenine34) deaminase